MRRGARPPARPPCRAALQRHPAAIVARPYGCTVCERSRALRLNAEGAWRPVRGKVRGGRQGRTVDDPEARPEGAWPDLGYYPIVTLEKQVLNMIGNLL